MSLLIACYAVGNGSILSEPVCVSVQNFTVPEDLSAYDGVELRVKGDGRRYKLIIRTSYEWDTIGYTASFDTTKGEWQSVCCINSLWCKYLHCLFSDYNCIAYPCVRLKYLSLHWYLYFVPVLKPMLRPLMQATSLHYRYHIIFLSLFLCVLCKLLRNYQNNRPN